MSVLAAHDILRVVDCVAYGCINEADTGFDTCARHRMTVKTCRIEGCSNPAREGAPTRGPHANLCDDHRKKASAVQSERTRVGMGQTGVTGAAVSKPEPAATPTPGVDGFEARAQRLVEAGRSLDGARLALDAAQAEWDAARAALEI